MKKLFLLLLSVLISTQTFAASSALNFGSLGVRSSGMIGTDLTSYTPTITGLGSTSSVEFFYRRVGDSLFIQGKFISGVGAATEVRFSLPTGLTIDSTKIPSKIGAGIMHQNSTASRAWDILISGGLSYVTVGRWDGGNNPLNNANGDNVDGGGGSTLYFNATMPIAGWTSGGDGASPSSQVFVTNGTGFGSTNTRIRRYTTTQINTGSDITYADSAANGGSFTINTTGTYSVEAYDYRAGGSHNVGISVNGSALTTDIGSVSWAQGFRCRANSGGNDRITHCDATLRLNSGDVVRMQGDANQDTSAGDTFTGFNIIRLN